MQWFKHDSKANRDGKLEKLMLKYGSDGYALYWLCLELITDRIDAQHVTFELEHDAETLGARLKIDTLRVEEIMRWLVANQLFESQDDRITCLKLAKRLDGSLLKSPEMMKIRELVRTNIPEVPGSSRKSPARVEEIREEENRREEEGENAHEETSLASVLPNPSLFLTMRNIFQQKFPTGFANPAAEMEHLNWMVGEIYRAWPDDASAAAKAILEKFWHLVHNGNRFQKTKPFLPSALRFLWGDVLKALEVEHGARVDLNDTSWMDEEGLK